MIIQKLIYLVFAALTLAASEVQKGFKSELITYIGEDPIVQNVVIPRFNAGVSSDGQALVPAHENSIEMFTFYVAKQSGSHTFYNIGPHKRWFYFGATVCDVDPRKSIQESAVKKYIENNSVRVTVDLVEGEVYPIKIVETPDFMNGEESSLSLMSQTFVKTPAGFENLTGNSYTAMNLKDKVEPSKSGGCAAPVLPHKGQLYKITGYNGEQRFVTSNSPLESDVYEVLEESVVYDTNRTWFELSNFNLSVTGYFTPKKWGTHKLITLSNGCLLKAVFSDQSVTTNINTPFGQRFELTLPVAPGEFYPLNFNIECDFPYASLEAIVQDPDGNIIYDFSDYVVEEKP